MNNRKRKPLCSKSDSELEGCNVNDNDNIFKLYFEKGSLQEYYRKYGDDEDDSEIDQNLKLCRKSSCSAFKNDFFKELISPDHLKKSIIGLGDGGFYQEQETHMFYDSCCCSPFYSPCSPCANNCCIPRCLSPLPPYIPVPIAECYPKKPKEEQRNADGTGIENLDGEKRPGILGSIFGKIQSSVSAIKGSMSSMSAMLSKSKMGSKMMGSKAGGGPSTAMQESGFRKSSGGVGGGWADEDMSKSRSHYGSGIGSERSHGWLAGSSSTKVKSNEWGAYMMERTIFNKPKKVKDAFLKVRFNPTPTAPEQGKMVKKDFKPRDPVKDENSNFILPKRKSNESKKNTNLWTESSAISPVRSEQKSPINHYYSQKYGHATRSKYSQKSKKDYVDEKTRLKTIREVYKRQHEEYSQNHPYDNDYFLESAINKSFKNSSTMNSRENKNNRIRFYNSDCSSDDGRRKDGLFYREIVKSGGGRKSLKPSRNHHNFSNNERNESFVQKDKFSDYFAPTPKSIESQRQRTSTSTNNNNRNKRAPIKHHKIKDPWDSVRINEYEDQKQRNDNQTEQIETRQRSRPRSRSRMVKPPIYQKDYSISDNLRNIRNIPELLQLHQRISSIESLAPLLRINNSINYQCSQNFNLNIQQNEYENEDFGQLYESKITQAYESQQVLKVIKEPKRKAKPEIKYLYSKSKSKSKSKGKKESSSKNYNKTKHVVHFSENIQDQKMHHKHNHKDKDKNKSSKKDTSKSKSKSFNSTVKSLFYLWKRS